MVKLLACRARGPGFRFPVSPLLFHRLVISFFQVAIWLKNRSSGVNTQNNQPTKHLEARHTLDYHQDDSRAEMLKCFETVIFSYTSNRKVRQCGYITCIETNAAFRQSEWYSVGQIL